MSVQFAIRENENIIMEIDKNNYRDTIRTTKEKNRCKKHRIINNYKNKINV